MADPRVVFYYDLFNPESYLFAELVAQNPSRVTIWQPLCSEQLSEPNLPIDSTAYRSEIEAAAKDLQLQGVKWPTEWPAKATDAVSVALFAQQIGRVVAYSLAAMRQAFAGGNSLNNQDTLLLAAAACEMHPRAVLQYLTTKSAQSRLSTVAVEANEQGIKRLPALQVGSELFYGYNQMSLAFLTQKE